MNNPLRHFNSSHEVIRLAVMMYIRYPLSLRQVRDILFERGKDICHETVRFWWNRVGPMFAGEIRKRRVRGGNGSNWRWLLDDVFVRINGERHYLWRAVDHEGEALEVFVTERQDRQAALKYLTRTMKRYGRPRSIVTDRLRSYSTAMKALGNPGRQECGRWLSNRAENLHKPVEGGKGQWRGANIKTLQKITAAQASIHNHFNHQRRLNRGNETSIRRTRVRARAPNEAPTLAQYPPPSIRNRLPPADAPVRGTPATKSETRTVIPPGQAHVPAERSAASSQ